MNLIRARIPLYRLSLAVALCVSISKCSPAQQLHVLIAADQRAGLPGFELTVGNIFTVLKSAKQAGIPVNIVQIDPKRISPERVLGELRSLQNNVGPADSFLFYYIGHGGTDLALGHILLTSGGPLLRSEVRIAAEQLGGKGNFLITDCCSVEIPGVPAAFAPVLGEKAQRMFRSLFLNHPGTYDVTAATFDPNVPGSGKAFYTGGRGGIFTSVFTMSIFDADTMNDITALLSWKSYFPILQGRVAEEFQNFRRQEINNGTTNADLIGTAEQKPQAFQLGNWAGANGKLALTAPRPGKKPRLGAIIHTNYGFGVVVDRTVKDSPAENIVVARVVNGQNVRSNERLLRGDLITEANGQPVNSTQDLFEILDKVSSGGEMILKGRDKSADYSIEFEGVVTLP